MNARYVLGLLLLVTFSPMHRGARVLLSDNKDLAEESDQMLGNGTGSMEEHQDPIIEEAARAISNCPPECTGFWVWKDCSAKNLYEEIEDLSTSSSDRMKLYQVCSRYNSFPVCWSTSCHCPCGSQPLVDLTTADVTRPYWSKRKWGNLRDFFLQVTAAFGAIVAESIHPRLKSDIIANTNAALGMIKRGTTSEVQCVKENVLNILCFNNLNKQGMHLLAVSTGICQKTDLNISDCM